MAGEEERGDDKTEAPTPRRLEKARQEGQVAQSREVSGFAALLLATLAAAAALPLAGESLLLALRAVLQRSHELDPAAGWEVAWQAALAVLPVIAAAAVGGAGATLLQTRGLVSAKALKPQFSRLSPLKGFKRIFGVDGLAEFLRTLAKMIVVGLAVWQALGAPETLSRVLHLPAAGLLAAAGGEAGRLAAAALAAFSLVALADYLWSRHRHLKRLRMSRQDLKEEMKETDGDPHVKARIRALRQQRARRRMMAAVPRAAVVVTNPTHFAVALGYEEGGTAAPRVLAKGADAVAARIRERAREAGVPVVANPPLARALYRLELEAEIPVEHYQAVAEIIAFVWRARGRA